MKKRLVALITILLLVASLSLSTFAANGFNKAVFDNAEDVSMKRDDMTGQLVAVSESLLGIDGIAFPESGGGYVNTYMGVSISDSMNLSLLVFKYYASDWAFINRAIIKIGDKRYTFDNLDTSYNVLKDARINETFSIEITSKSMQMMTDLINHRDEDIKIRLHGTKRDIDFVLTDEMKNGIINIWNLYVAGGGTSKESMQMVDIGTEITVTVGQD